MSGLVDEQGTGSEGQQSFVSFREECCGVGIAIVVCRQCEPYSAGSVNYGVQEV